MACNLDHILNSRAKWQVLETLFFQTAPISIRKISRLCEIPIRSVVLALNDLEDQEVVFSRQDRHKKKYTLNPKHPDYQLIQNIFSLIKRHDLEKRSHTYAVTAKSILQFQKESHRLINQGLEKDE